VLWAVSRSDTKDHTPLLSYTHFPPLHLSFPIYFLPLSCFSVGSMGGFLSLLFFRYGSSFLNIGATNCLVEIHQGVYSRTSDIVLTISTLQEESGGYDE